jgi:hypothetical protein
MEEKEDVSCNSLDNNYDWTKEELQSLSKFIPSSLQSNEDFSEWLVMPEIQ